MPKLDDSHDLRCSTADAEDDDDLEDEWAESSDDDSGSVQDVSERSEDDDGENEDDDLESLSSLTSSDEPDMELSDIMQDLGYKAQYEVRQRSKLTPKDAEAIKRLELNDPRIEQWYCGTKPSTRLAKDFAQALKGNTFMTTLSMTTRPDLFDNIDALLLDLQLEGIHFFTYMKHMYRTEVIPRHATGRARASF